MNHRQPIAVSDISIYICLINIRNKSKEQLNERRAGLSNESFTCISRKDGNKTKIFPSQGCAAQTATGTLKNGLYLKDKFSLLKICFDLLLVV